MVQGTEMGPQWQAARVRVQGEGKCHERNSDGVDRTEKNFQLRSRREELGMFEVHRDTITKSIL